MSTPVNRRGALIAGGAGLIALAGGAPFLLKRAQAEPAAQWVAPRQPSQSPTPSPTPEVKAVAFDLSAVDPTNLVKISAAGWHSWALMDRLTGAIIGSANFNQTNRACSMIKSWIAVDYLAQVPSPKQSRLDEITIMIRDSDSITADSIMDELGRLKSMTRLKNTCKTTDFTPSNSWSKQVISARDTCRLADAIMAGRVANPKWTAWVLDLMRTVRRGTWGVRAAFPPAEQATIAIKNGWDITSATGDYHANCLAVTDRWAMSVLTRYSASKVKSDESHGATIAESISKQLLESSELRPLFT